MLPFVQPTLGFPKRANVVTVKEHVVALHKPEDTTLKDFLPLLGENAYKRTGKDGLLECITRVFKRSEKADTLEVAIVITRPPETYCVVQAEFGNVYFRDSHRRKQRDFQDWVVECHPRCFLT